MEPTDFDEPSSDMPAPLDQQLAFAAGAALGQEVRSAAITSRTPIVYDPFLPGRTVERVTGVAVQGAGKATTWEAIVKRTTGGGLGAARRELVAYRRGIAARRRSGVLHAPALLASSQGAGHVELWLENLTDEHAGHWPLSRYGLAAQHIASWDADMSTARPDVRLNVDGGWAAHHGQPNRVPAAVDRLTALCREPAAVELMAQLEDDGFRRTRAMITATAARVEALARFPPSLLHHDLVRSNLFALPGAQTAAIDWEYVGPGPLGVDLAPLVVGSVRRGEDSADGLSELEHRVLLSYEEALTAAGADARGMRRAYRLALGLRWHVVLGTVQAWLDPTITKMRGSRPGESRTEGLHHLMVLSRHLLESADEGVG